MPRRGLKQSMYCLLIATSLGLAGASANVRDRPAQDSSGQPAFDSQAALALSQEAIGRELGDYRFTDRRGRSVRLSELLGKPLVISPIYTSCYHTCPMTTRYLSKAVQIAREALGDDSFRVLTVGFDAPVDTPQAMAAFARKQGVDPQQWYFLSVDRQTRDRLMHDIGFTYAPSPKGFDHLIQATLVDAQGTVYRQVYGELINTPQLVEPLKQLVFGEPAQGDRGMLSGLLDRVRLYCVAYDPNSDRYYFDYSLFIGMGIGLLIIGSASTYLVKESRRQRPPRT